MSAGTVGWAYSERGMSVYTVAGPQYGSLSDGFWIEPVAIHTVGRAQSVSSHLMSWAELVPIDAMS